MFYRFKKWSADHDFDFDCNVKIFGFRVAIFEMFALFFLFYGQMIGFEPTISFFITKLILYFQMFALCSMENRLSLIRTFEMKAFDLIYPPF